MPDLKPISKFLFAVLSCWFLFSTSLFAVSAKAESEPPTPISPYLKKHQDDLVKWLPWNRATLQLARDSGKLILLSSGYFACHFCHVQERESFENPQIADYINQHFIPVIIDRELNPELDSQLLRFMEIIGTSQGWPVNVILTSDAYPLYGTIYRPADAFLEFLQQIQGKWQQQRDHWQNTAKAASKHIVDEATVPAMLIDNPQQQSQILDAFEQQAKRVADLEYGGFGNGAKYPMSPQLLALLRFYVFNPSPWLETHIRKTLRIMAAGALQDHINGGFFRYATDRQWRVPHYEKMLYDNAQLALVYLEAARTLDDPTFLQVAIDTLAFLQQSMSMKNGGFVASLSAVDERGLDGGYYLWDKKELAAILQANELQLVTRLWQVIEAEPGLQQQRYLPGSHASTNTKAIKQKILEATKRRRLPRDEKQLAGWNGLTLLTFARAANYLSEPQYRKTADDLYRFVAEELWIDGQLRQTPLGGVSALADYAYIAAGLLEYARLTGEIAHYQLSADLVAQAWQRFHIEGFWRRSEETELLLPYTVYPVTLADSEPPSPAATLVAVTLQLHDFLDPAYLNNARRAQKTVDSNLIESPFFYATQISGWQTP